MMQSLTAPELQAWLNDATRDPPTLLDVREAWEVEKCHIDGSQHIAMREIPGRLAEIETSQPVVCICHHGARSMQVAQFLLAQGRSNVINLTGGIDAWAQQVDASVARY